MEILNEESICSGIRDVLGRRFRALLKVLLFLAALSWNAFADRPYLLKDISGPYWGLGNLGNFTNVNNVLFFSTDANDYGYEIWKSDGTESGTVLIKDIYPGIRSSNPYKLICAGGICYFFADDGVHGSELWRSDGTTEGTWLVKDIRPGSDSSRTYKQPKSVVDVNGTIYFSADDGVHGNELWCSNGTTGSTCLVKDIYPSGNSDPYYMEQIDGILYFFASSTSGRGLWRTDGTAEGTEEIYQIHGEDLTCSNGKLFFSSGELYCSDGTTAGTYLVKDINPSGNSYPNWLTDVNGILFFTAEDEHGDELWKSNGTSAGTKMVKDLNPSGSSWPEQLTNINGILYFVARASFQDSELYRSNGTYSGTYMVKNINPSGGSSPQDIIEMGGLLYFHASVGGDGPELRSYDEATDTLLTLTNVYPDGLMYGFWPIYHLTRVDNLLFFKLSDSNSDIKTVSLYTSDGTVTGTKQLKYIERTHNNDSIPFGFTFVNGIVYFGATDPTHGCELWKTDGTTDGTTLVKDIYPGIAGAINTTNPHFYPFENCLLFTATNPNEGTSLWRTDGTTEGTTIVKKVRPESDLTQLNSKVYFAGYAQPYSSELWCTDGTEPNTVLVKDINPSGSSNINGLTRTNDSLIFSANDGIHGTEPWKSDGTEAGTVLLEDIEPGSSGSGPSSFYPVSDKVFFTTRTSMSDEQLWVTDVTAYTTIVKRINLGGSSRPRILGSINELLCFIAYDGSHYAIWKTDGTESGTQILRSLGVNSYSRYQVLGKILNGIMYFGAGDDEYGFELWRTDGTQNGTYMVKDISTGPLSSEIQKIEIIQGQLFLQIYSQDSKNQIWLSDGTGRGTVVLDDFDAIKLQQNNPKSNISYLENINNTFFFSANDDINGIEPWLYRMDYADTDLNGKIDFLDYATLAANWMRFDCNISNNWCDYSDVTDYGLVDFKDLDLLTQNWLDSRCNRAQGFDINGDCKVDNTDFAQLANQWMRKDCGDCSRTDYTGDGNVDFSDLKVLSANWLVDY